MFYKNSVTCGKEFVIYQLFIIAINESTFSFYIFPFALLAPSAVKWEKPICQ